MTTVSILVLVDVALEHYYGTAYVGAGYVSILVLVDVALEQARHGERPGHHGVSILVLVDVALELAGWKTRVATPSIVSILVLVDVALERNGNRTKILGHVALGFQSLFSWMSLWNCGNHRTILDLPEFQSLFSWMSLWNPIRRSVSLWRCTTIQVSILVLVDVALERA